MPPAAKDEKTVLENVTTVTRQYGDAFATRFSAQLYRKYHRCAAQTVYNPANLHQRVRWDPLFISGRRGGLVLLA